MIEGIIAEAGTNHADSDPRKRLNKALNYVRLASDAGADIVKFQMFSEPLTDMFCWIKGDENRAARWLNSVIPLSQWRLVKHEADSLGITLLASVFQDKTIEWIEELELKATKVASRAAKDFPYGKGPKPYLVSNGMYSVPKDVIEFQCEAKYPSTQWWKGKTPGFSDHSGNPERAIAAIEKGCKLIEVHFYEREEDAGPDLLAGLTLDELAFVCHGR